MRQQYPVSELLRWLWEVSASHTACPPGWRYGPCTLAMFSAASTATKPQLATSAPSTPRFQAGIPWPLMHKELLARGIRVGKDRVPWNDEQHGIRMPEPSASFVVPPTAATVLPCWHQTRCSGALPRGTQPAGRETSPIATDEGWLYLAQVIDLFSRQVRLEPPASAAAGLVRQTHWPWRGVGGHPTGLIFHSDRGSQYCSGEWPDRFERLAMRVPDEQEGKPLATTRPTGASHIRRLKTFWWMANGHAREAKQAVLDPDGPRWLVWRRFIHRWATSALCRPSQRWYSGTAQKAAIVSWRAPNEGDVGTLHCATKRRAAPTAISYSCGRVNGCVKNKLVIVHERAIRH